MTVTPHSGTDGLTEDQSPAVLNRLQILRPHLETHVRLARVIPEQNLSFRTMSRCGAHYDEFWLRWRCCKPDAGKDKRRMLPTLQQYIKELVMRNLDPKQA